jgi:hypothetical protein
MPLHYPRLGLGSLIPLAPDIVDGAYLRRNRIKSETDIVVVYMFIAEVVAILLPSCGLLSGD